MTQVMRLSAPAGLLLDRTKPISFRFAGEKVEGFAGDTIASALAANGISVLSRSFKYHRPRGILTMAGQDANSLVQLPDEPNVLADIHPISPGLEVTAQNVKGSLAHDRRSVIDLIGGFLPVGFYYKAFFRPLGAWRRWEPVIRNLAGLGRVKLDAHHGYYDKAYAFADVLVIGGGPAGLAAAIEAGKTGAEVILIEEGATLGGSLAYARFVEEPSATRSLREHLVSEVASLPNVTIHAGTRAQGLFADNWVPFIRANRLYKARAKSVVLATGSTEQHLVFRNNDLPGVMMGSAAQRLIKLYGVKPGERAVIATANADGYGVALDLTEAGVEVAALVDLREIPAPDPRVESVQAHRLRILSGHTVVEAIPARGKRGIAGAAVARITAEGIFAAKAEALDCDLICMDVGYSPAYQLAAHAGTKVGYAERLAMFQLGPVPKGVHAAGSVNGVYDLEAVLADGRRAGWKAAGEAGLFCGPEPSAPEPFAGADGLNHPWPIFPHPRGRDFVDFDEDLQVKDLLAAMAEGFDHIELLKRYSTVGMGPSQGRHSALPTARIAARTTGHPIGEIGVTTARPPVGPEKFAHLAGRGFEPVRLTAMHHRHIEAGAQMMPAGLWLRPAYYGAKDKREEAITAEVRNVRENVGIIDVSTLGGLEVRGPDAAEFLERIYTFAYKKQPIGRCRYVLMTDMAGVIADDGVAARLAEQHFYVTATTSGVQGVYQNMLWYNAQWRLAVDVTQVTASYAGVNIAGPHSRSVLSRIVSDADLSPTGFPYMGVREGHVGGIPARIMRVGFVGELGYEIHVPASQGEALWDALMEAGRPLGIRPFGVEAQRQLRLEKGHIIVSQDTDGLTTPEEAGMEWAIAKAKPFFVGKRSIEIQRAAGVKRKLVGFVLEGGADDRIPKECHLVLREGEITGRITSVGLSPVLGKVVGLAFVAIDQAEPGSRFDIKIENGEILRAIVTKSPFYDPENKRQEM
ncbi:MAG TPA: 2Fe-2S iron-sulfur cluster-binding protein [Alphaproteobacteria bacterium]|nr:2Fe-2S iron-sulfur cluster-binding protein [Alphaproteobacteria bacterium]